jgi:hypothetical protein
MGRDKDLEIEDFDMTQMEEQSADLLELRYLNKENTKFTKTPGGFVALEYNGKTYERVGIYRTFPFTDPNSYISIREADEKAREIGVIKDLVGDVAKDVVDILNEQLALRYFTPVIQKINEIKEEYGYAYFEVKTNFGACKFTIHMNGGSVVHLSENRILITDLDGNRFEIPDLDKLTAAELKKLDLFL